MPHKFDPSHRSSASMSTSSERANLVIVKALKLEFGGLAEDGKWLGKLLESAGVEARPRLLSLSSAALDHHTLLLSPLPSAPSLSQLESFSETSEPDSDPSSLSLPLHHLDALSSSQTPSQLFHLRLGRDSLHFNSLTSLAYNRTRPGPPSSGFSSSIVSGLSQGSDEYFTCIDYGSPPKYLYMVLDTGSDVVWLQCAPCKHCYSQTDPVFYPRKSSSFSSLPCSSPLCRHLDSLGCSSKSKTCLYQVSYGNGSFTFGDFSTETLTFRRSKVPKVALGCCHDNEGLFVGAAGKACRRTCKAGEHRARLTKLVTGTEATTAPSSPTLPRSVFSVSSHRNIGEDITKTTKASAFVVLRVTV
ncbi:hypothetical protein ACLB2K_012478 [Fragaria x ananassa]